jgi:hypothetical protein
MHKVDSLEVGVLADAGADLLHFRSPKSQTDLLHDALNPGSVGPHLERAVGSRVTRLGEFLRLLRTDFIILHTEVAQILGYFFPLEPILRFLNLQLQRQRCSRLERFFKVEDNIFVSKTR